MGLYLFIYLFISTNVYLFSLLLKADPFLTQYILIVVFLPSTLPRTPNSSLTIRIHFISISH